MRKAVFIISLLLLILAGCSKDKENELQAASPKEETPKTENQENEKTDEVKLPEEATFTAPFTGEQVKEEIQNRPVLVTINNHPKARPQAGIGSADMIYEMEAEGSVTRFLALYQSEMPDRFGPVRSARDYFVDIAKGLDAFYVAHGYSPEARQMLSANVVDNINGMQYDGTLFERSHDRVAPHNSYISYEHLQEGMEKLGVRTKYEKLSPFVYYESADDAKIGEMAGTIDVRYGHSESFHNQYVYDPLTQTYGRAVGGTTTIDADTEQPVTISNVLCFEVNQRTIDAKGRQQVDLMSGGKAYLFQAGIVKLLEWKNVNGILVAMENGSPAKLVPGSSWVHLINANQGLDSQVKFTP